MCLILGRSLILQGNLGEAELILDFVCEACLTYIVTEQRGSFYGRVYGRSALGRGGPTYEGKRYP